MENSRLKNTKNGKHGSSLKLNSLVAKTGQHLNNTIAQAEQVETVFGGGASKQYIYEIFYICRLRAFALMILGKGQEVYFLVCNLFL